MMLDAAISNPLLILGLVLVFAVLLGDAAERMGVPWITGCVLAGVLLGPDAIGVLTPSKLSVLGGFLQASLALIAFNIGSQLTLAKIRGLGASIVWLALAQLLAPLLAVLAALTLVGLSWPTALIAAAVAPATAPTTTYAIFRRRNASGPFVDRALGVLAVNDAATIVIFSVISATVVAWLGAQASPDETWTALGHAAMSEALSLAVGAALGGLYVAGRALIADGRPGWQDRLRAMLYALLLLAVGAALAFGLSHLLTPLAMGIVIANAGRATEQAPPAAVGDVEQPLYMIFFVLAGAHLPVADVFGHAALVAATGAYVLARIGGKYAAIYLGATALRLDRGTRRFLGLCFPSQGGAAMGLVLACNDSAAVRAMAPSASGAVEMAVSVVLLGVLFSQIFGPIVIDYAVRHGSADAVKA
jgi:Kef-type K+ transport system membrane component KefB